MRRWDRVGRLLLGIGLVLGGLPAAFAVITAPLPLSAVLKENDFIYLAKVEKLHPEKPAVVLTVTEDLKGKLPFRRLPVNLTGDKEARQHDHTAQLLKRLAPELPLVLFTSQRGKLLTVFGYTNGTWFQMVGRPTAGKEESIVLGFTHCEPFLRRTFKGTTEELKQVVVDGLAGKRKPPDPDLKEPPGLGAEVKTSKSARAGAQGGPLFAVIPTLGIGGPLAILALLFPSLFGGVLVLFRRWTAFFTVVSVVSMLYMLQGWFALYFWGAWWTSQSALWLAITLTTLAGVLWAWRRHLSYVEVQPMSPALDRTERRVLGILSAACLAVVLIYALNQSGAGDTTFNLLLAFSAGVWVAALYKLYRCLVTRSWFKPPLPTEGVILWAALCVLSAFAALQPGQRGVSSEVSATGDGPALAQLQTDHTWRFVFTGNGSGSVFSSPRVVGDRIYVSVAHRKAPATFGVLYCLDRNTQKVLWTFDDDGGMKQAFSSPCVADGRVYVGEGFHDDVNCKLYCVKADTGAKVWEFETDGQTESTPCVAGGKVYFGGGNDGVYALDAASGKELWRYPGKSYKGRLIRFGASPVAVGKRLYVGSGVDRNRPDDPGETAFFCLDADTGELKWKTPTDLPVWAPAVVAGEQVFVGLGNGDILKDASSPAGAMLCLDARTGRQLWRTDVANGVLDRPAVDRHSVYFGSRDRHCYCLNRFTGAQRWKKDLGSAVIAGPSLDHDSTAGTTAGVFVVARGGAVACLDPVTGKSHWTYHDLERDDPHLSSAPTVIVTPGPDGERRRLYFGAAFQELSIPVLYSLEDFVPR